MTQKILGIMAVGLVLFITGGTCFATTNTFVFHYGGAVLAVVGLLIVLAGLSDLLTNLKD